MKPSVAFRAATYLRVSSDAQSYENQRPDVLGVVATRGYDLVATYEEQAGAAAARPAFAQLLTDAHRGRFDVVVVWALDRLGRSLVGNLQTVLELDRRGVQVVSVREPWLDTGGPVRGLLLAIFSWVAEQERLRLSERTRAGMARARARGIHVGRPPARVDVVQAQVLRAAGLTLDQVAVRLRVAPATLKRALARFKRGVAVQGG